MGKSWERNILWNLRCYVSLDSVYHLHREQSATWQQQFFLGSKSLLKYLEHRQKKFRQVVQVYLGDGAVEWSDGPLDCWIYNDQLFKCIFLEYVPLQIMRKLRHAVGNFHEHALIIKLGFENNI